MTSEAIRLAIMNAISSSWATATDVAWPNQPYHEHSEAYIAPVIKFGNSAIGELGADGIGIRYGLLMISIFVLPGTGTKTASGYADRIEAIFRREEIGGVIFDEPSSDYIGQEDNGYYHVMVKVNFETWIGE